MNAANFEEYHTLILPGLIADGRGALLRGLQLPVLGLSIAGGPVFSYQVRKDGVEIIRGEALAQLRVELTEADWQGLVEDLETVPGILYGERLLSHSGNLMGFMQWEPALRALYTGRPIYDAAHFVLKNSRGDALDPLSAFTLSDAPREMREFLDAAGYLLVQDVFDAGELQEFRAAASDIAKASRQGDQHSWWGRSDSGEAVLCRCLNAGGDSRLSGLYDDERIIQLSRLLPTGMLHPAAGDKDGVTVIYKNPGVVEGLSDLPWHRDCGMGGHSRMCPTYIFSIYLYDATADSGPLQFLPGSHHYVCGFADSGGEVVPGAITVPARAGDVSVHIGDVMHAAPPPAPDSGSFRQSVLLAFHPDFENHRGERHYNDVLLGDEAGQVSHLRALVDQ